MLNIEPMWFYWINILDTLDVTFAIIAIIAVIIGVVVIVMLLAFSVLAEYDDETLAKKFFKFGIICIVIAAICCLGYIFVPNKETLIEMQVAKLATPENAEMPIEKLKAVVDYIIEKVRALK